MRSRARTLTAALAAVAAVLALAACGDSHTKVTTGTYAGESGANAPYLNVGPLIYEVQLSRELNPANSEDAGYLQGLGAAESKLEPGQEWFAVFVQVFNNTSQAQVAAGTMTISDTQGNTYAPIVPGPVNQYAYRGGTVPAKGQLPEPNTTAAQGATGGLLLLYKIKVVSLDNRPLEIKITNPDDLSESASAELDV
jgi:hypothetical protein